MAKRSKRNAPNASAVTAVTKLVEHMIGIVRRAIFKRDGPEDDCEISSPAFRRLREAGQQLLQHVTDSGDQCEIVYQIIEAAMEFRERYDNLAWMGAIGTALRARNGVMAGAKGAKTKGDAHRETIRAEVRQRMRQQPRDSVSSAAKWVCRLHGGEPDEKHKGEHGWSWQNIKLAIRGMKKPKA